MRKKFYLTTAIPYVNSPPHLGFALELVQADVIARHFRLSGYDVFLTTGTDENAQKNVLTAKEKGISVKKFVQDHALLFKKLTKILNISNNVFLRTSDKKNHFPAVKKIWQKCKKRGDIYKKKYSGLYCVGCEAFLTKKELKHGVCPEHLKKPEEIFEENYFFKLSKYKDSLKELIEKEKIKIVPSWRKKEVLQMIKYLEDLSVSRPSERLSGWGIPVPKDPSQTIYVWMDALTYYLSSLNYGKKNERIFKKYWPPDLQIIGKGILKFHAIFWPAFLLSANLKLPKAIFAHGYLTVGGQKMSKSLGNFVEALPLIEKYGSDSVRYFLLREIPASQDGDFTFEKFERRYQDDLVKGLGNLVSRILGIVEKYSRAMTLKLNSFDKNLTNQGQNVFQKNKKLIENFEFDKALISVWDFISSMDKFIENEKPWQLLKEGKKEKLNFVITTLLNSLSLLAWFLSPFLPQTSLKIAKALNLKKLMAKKANYKNIDFPLRGKLKIKKISALFPKLES